MSIDVIIIIIIIIIIFFIQYMKQVQNMSHKNGLFEIEKVGFEPGTWM